MMLHESTCLCEFSIYQMESIKRVAEIIEQQQKKKHRERESIEKNQPLIFAAMTTRNAISPVHINPFINNL